MRSVVDRVATVGVENGWAGAVIFGAIRDSAGIGSLEFGVKVLGVTAHRGFVRTEGARNLPVSFGSARFEPGFWVYADQDAVIVSPSALAIDGSDR
jgi:regulator of ribonuclease activity A